ncbi:hemagglutinin repeat-containing protein [Burkholderia gladioli]|uniref:hemagglutinin repeat-containing protein n=1 Tax=Burkholderia gladioli TaxID=28095 RepID=UPI003C7C1130
MNKNSHRLVFSRVHGMFVAVEETVHAPGRGNEGKSVVAARVPHLVARFALRQVAFAAWLAAGATPLTGKVQVAGSGAHAPSVIQTPNGLPQVNINKPGGGGVSLNTYSRFDVQKPGVIVNNSAVMTNTQQAGYINGNPNFGANDAARIIVNQVNSNNPSQLRGFIEIAGQRAEMIMSNPSGLVVDGGGFINTSRAILTTGTPNLNADGSLAGFNVTRGLIAVRGAGLDATNVDQVDLISRAIEANAAIHASTLNVVTGANRVDHDLLRATRIQGEGAAPAVAIDVGQLGGMYGNRIFLVGTEGGVGVRNAGTIAADAMGLTLNTDGRLTQAGKLSSLGNLVVSAVAGMENSGTTYAGQSASLDTGADVANAGALAAQHGVELRAGTLNSTGMLGSGVNGDGAVTQAGDLEVTTVGQLTATGLNIAGGKFSATGAGVNLAGGTTAAAGELSLRATTGDVNLANATTSAQGAATAKAAGTIANDHGVLTSSGSATLSGGTVSNQGGSVSSKGLLSVTAAEQIANQTGTLVSAGTMVLHGGKLANNQGTIQSEGHAIVEGATIDNTAGRIISLNADGLRLNTTGLLTNAAGAAGIGAQGGVITGNGDVTIQAASIRNTQGGQLSGANLQVLGTSLDNSGGRIGSVQDTNGDVYVTMNGAIANTGGQIGSNHDLTVKAATLQDGGAYKAARDAALSMQGDFSTTPDFQLNAGRNLVFTLSGTFSNGASIQAVNEVSIDAGNIVNRGTMMAGGLLRAQSADLVNSGSIVGGSTSINATGTASNLGPSALIGASDSQGTLEILAPDIENRDDSTATDATATAAILGMGTLVLAGGKDAASHYTNAALVNNSSALIQSGGDMQLHADKLVNKRRVMSTSTGSIDPATLAQFGIQIKGQTGQINVKDPNNIGGVYTEPPHEGHWNSDYHFTTYYADSATATTVAGLSPAAQIVSGGNIDASRSGTLRNYWSSITAVGNLQMPRYYDADGWAASGQQAPGVTVSYSGQYHYNNYNNQEHDWQLPFGNAPFVTRHPGGYTQAAPRSFKDYSLPDYRSTLGANGAISGTGVSVHNTAANASLPPLGLLPGQAVQGLDQSLTGTQLEGGGAVTIASGKDLSIIGSTVSLDKGNAILIAAGDVNIGATAETHELNSRETHSHGNIVSGAKIASGVDRTATDSQGSTVSADGIHIVSSRDINVAGSNVVGTNDVALQASRNVNITTSQDTTQSSSYYQKRESGLLTNGGLSLTVGSRSGAEQDQNRSVTNNASVIGSSQGNLSIQAGKDAAITGSTLVAGQNVGINAQNVSVNTAYDSYEDAQSRRFSQSGLSVGLGGGLLGLGQSMASTVRQGQQSGDSRLAAVQAVAAVGQTYRSRGGLEDAVGALSGGNLSEAAKGVQVQLGIGSSHSSNNATTSITHAKGSSIIGNGDVSITARGSPDADGNAQAGTGNIALTGTSLLGKDVTLDANNAILLQSARSTEQGSSSNSSTGWNAGIAIGVGKSTGISVFANGSNAHGRGNGDSVTQTNTTVAASNTLTMKSGGDTALAGAQLSGDKVKADVGGNLTIASLQDMSSYGNNQHNAGGSGGFTLGPGGGGSIDASIGHTSIDSNYASVNQQTGIVAGKQGFDVEVAGHTQLNGAQIASVAPADHNTLTTNTLGFSDIQNRMSYSGSSEGISLSGGPSFAQTGDSASGVTHAAVSPAKIVVKSDQQNGTDSTAGLSRDTANANETVQSTFNLREVQNNLAFAHAFGKVATFALAEAATKLADSSPEMKTLFGEGGAGRDAMHAAVAAIGAALSGGNVGGAVAGSLAGDVLQSLAQPIVDQTGVSCR